MNKFSSRPMEQRREHPVRGVKFDYKTNFVIKLMHSLFSRLYYPQITLLAAITFIALLCRPAFCGEIHDAAKFGDLAKVKALLKDNPDLVFSKDDYGQTPLHYAAYFCQKDVAELLLAKKADVNAKENHDGTPLYAAATKGYKDMVELLLANH